MADPAPLPELFLYGKPGCHLCAEARTVLDRLLAARADAGLPVAAIVERDILSDPAWERSFFLTIPVLEADGRRLELATSQAKIRGFLERTLDGADRSDPSTDPATLDPLDGPTTPIGC